MPCFHVPRVPMETHAEKEGRRGADPGFERAKKQGGAALGRVRGRVSRRTTIRGVGGRVQVRRRRRRGAPSRANVPRNAKSKCRCEPSCQPASLQVDALAALPFAFPSSIFIFLVTRRAPSTRAFPLRRVVHRATAAATRFAPIERVVKAAGNRSNGPIHGSIDSRG